MGSYVSPYVCLSLDHNLSENIHLTRKKSLSQEPGQWLSGSRSNKGSKHGQVGSHQCCVASLISFAFSAPDEDQEDDGEKPKGPTDFMKKKAPKAAVSLSPCIV